MFHSPVLRAGRVSARWPELRVAHIQKLQLGYEIGNGLNLHLSMCTSNRVPTVHENIAVALIMILEKYKLKGLLNLSPKQTTLISLNGLYYSHTATLP